MYSYLFFQNKIIRIRIRIRIRILPPLLFFISLLYLFVTFPSSASFLFSHFFPSSPSFPPLVPFLYIPLHSFLPYIHSFLPPLSLACLLPFVSFCYLLPLLLFLPLLHFHFPSHIPFLPFLPHLSILLSFPLPSIYRPPLLPSILFLPTSSLPLSFSLLAPSLSLPFSLSLTLSHPTERYLSLSFGSLPLFFFPSFHFYPLLLPSPSLSYFPISLSLPSLCCVLYITQ